MNRIVQATKFFTLASAILASAPAMSGKPVSSSASGTSDIPVVVSLASSGGGYALRVQGDALGSYSNSGGVRSILTAPRTGNDLILRTYDISTLQPTDRSLFVDLTEPAGAGNPAPFAQEFVQSDLSVRCTVVGKSMVKMVAGAVILCPGHLRFQAPSGDWYRFGFNSSNYPDVQEYQVACLSANKSGCLSWKISPSGSALTGSDPNPKNVNKLLRIDAAGNILSEEGNYYLSFDILVSR